MLLLRVEKMSHDFGGLRAVNNYDLEVESGQIRGLIGPNGAGKTTIFNLITGIYKPTQGDIYLGGIRITVSNLTRLPPWASAEPFRIYDFGDT